MVSANLKSKSRSTHVPWKNASDDDTESMKKFKKDQNQKDFT
jgi:hypothetical protein